MTIIEFYDKVLIENIAGALQYEPQRVILVGDNLKRMKKDILVYQSILRNKGINTELSCQSVNRNDLRNIVDRLSAVVESNDDCVFDLTGGEELYLVAVGIIMARYEGRVRCHHFNLNNDRLYGFKDNGEFGTAKAFSISIEDNIALYGGKIITDPKKRIYTYDWDFSEDFRRDIDAIWSICKKSPRVWNSQISSIGAVSEIYQRKDTLKVAFDVNEAAQKLKQRGYKYTCVGRIMLELEKRGLITYLEKGEKISFAFKNQQVKRCLTVAGQALELAVANKMLALTEKDGSPVYHDVRVGVVIDWDGGDGKDEYRTVNEIDVMAMKGAIPVFISCKNGAFDVNELYKLNTVAERFGDKYSKKILITTQPEKSSSKYEHIFARMRDMKIRSITDAAERSDAEIERILRSLWV